MSDGPEITVSELTGSDTGKVVVAPVGEITFHEAPALQQVLRRVMGGRPARVVVDLGGVDYMSSPGVAALVEALQLSRKNRSRLVLCGMNERVTAVFSISRLLSVFEIVGDRATALA